MSAPIVIDDFLPADAYARMRAYVQAQPMLYGSKSNSKTDPHGHWSWKPVHDNNQNLADLSSQLPELLAKTWSAAIRALHTWEKPYVIIRCYANGYTYGTDGYFHTDSERADERTVIIYICDDWLGDWAGETVFKKPGVNEYISVLPAPNRAVIAPSNMEHAARAVSRKCTALRTTLMYKTRPRRSETFETLSRHLVTWRALDQPHKSGTLHDHLMRVYAALEARKLDPATCLGGGLHSIYGTNVYKNRLLEPNAANRAMLSGLFGKEAEALAYMFSVINRPAALDQGALRLQLRYDHVVAVEPAMLKSLQLIECANLADQGGLAKWPNLQRLWVP